MKRVITSIIGASLFLASSLLAQDNLKNGNSAFYPIENNDTPDYLLDNEVSEHGSSIKVLAKSTIDKDTLLALFPAENDDTPDYILDTNIGEQSNTTSVLVKSSISESTLCSIYPVEDDDSASFTRSC